MNVLRTDFTNLLSFHTCPEIFIFFLEWNIASGTIEIATVISVIMEELRFEWYWFAPILKSAKPRGYSRSTYLDRAPGHLRRDSPLH